MATSGTTTTAINSWLTLELKWVLNSQNVANNTSSVTFTASLITGNGNINSSTSKDIEIWVGTSRPNQNTVKFTGTCTIGMAANSRKVLMTRTADFEHDIHGNLYFSKWNRWFPYVTVDLNVILGGSWVGTKTLMFETQQTLPSILRESSISTSGTRKLGEPMTITITPAFAGAKHKLMYTFNGGGFVTIAENVTATTYDWTPPKSLAANIPNTTSGTMQIRCETYDDNSTLTGYYNSIATYTIADDTLPTISNVAISEATSGLAAKFQAYVQNKSTLNVAITAAGAYGSTITSYETYIQAVPYRTASFTSELISASGTVGVVTTVTDSRGRTAQVFNSINVIPYVPPKINSMTAYRIDTLGNASDEGTRIAMQMNFAISSVGNRNDHTFKIQYQEENAGSFTDISSGSASWAYNDTQKFTSSPTISIDKTYIVRLEISDFFQTVSKDFVIPTAFTLIDLRSTGRGIAFGKVSEEDRMEIALDVELIGDLLQEVRQTPTMLNSWSDYGSGYEEASYWKDACGVVHIAGFISGGTIADGTVIFNLPVGYRPRASEKFIVVSLNAVCIIDIYTNGNVTIRTGANSGWLSLSGIQFRAV